MQDNNFKFATTGHVSIQSTAQQPLYCMSRPVEICWDSGNGNAGNIEFPLKFSSNGSADLLRACHPSLFGTNPRRMDATEFWTRFHPHDVGIIDAITEDLPNNAGYRRDLRVKLSSLTVYSRGQFTRFGYPCSLGFGTLLIALPCEFNGGKLVVYRDGGGSVEVYWGSKDEISYAAFHKDCKYEIQEVTKGHLAILTYDLYDASQRPSLFKRR